MKRACNKFTRSSSCTHQMLGESFSLDLNILRSFLISLMHSLDGVDIVNYDDFKRTLDTYRVADSFTPEDAPSCIIMLYTLYTHAVYSYTESIYSIIVVYIVERMRHLFSQLQRRNHSIVPLSLWFCVGCCLLLSYRLSRCVYIILHVNRGVPV